MVKLCEICEEMKDILIPIAGSGVEINYICKQCIEERQLGILSEYAEKYSIKTEVI